MFPRYALVMSLTCASVLPSLLAFSEPPGQKKQSPTRGPEPLAFPKPEIEGRIEFQNYVLRALADGKFDELTLLAKELRTTKERLSNGEWKLRAFYQAFSQLGNMPKWYPIAFEGKDPDWNLIFARLDEWQNGHPTSITPRVARADAMLAYAWDARGANWAPEVSREQWKFFEERLTTVEKILEEAKTLEERCPEWFSVSERLATGQGWDRRRFDETVREAVASEPEYFAFYQMHARHLLPRWHGKPGEWEREAAQWVTKLGRELGEEAYARTVWYLRDTAGGNVFDESNIDWPLAQRGFLRMLQKYPESFEIKSVFALLSVQADDRTQARFLFFSLGNRMDRGVWRSEKQFRNSRDWASQTAGSR